MSDVTQNILDVLDRNLQSIWDGDVETYRATTADDVSFFEWYISPQRIDGLDFHLRELRVHKDVVSGGGGPVEHEILQPRVQIYGDTAVVTYTLLIRAAGEAGVVHKSHNETRVVNTFTASCAGSYIPTTSSATRWSFFLRRQILIGCI